MWLWNSIRSSIWGEIDDEGEVLNVDEAQKILNKVYESVPNPVEEAVKRELTQSLYHKTGKITSAFNDRYIIDNLYMFRTSTEELKVGDEVTFTIHHTEDVWKVSNVNKVQNSWACQEDDVGSSWSTRTLVTKVTRREGRNIVVSHEDLQIDLNSTASEFVPVVGDWLELDVKVENNEQVLDFFGTVVEVVKIRPLRLKVAEGKITTWDRTEKIGSIDKDIFFRGDELSPGYSPNIGDVVTAELIESEQGQYVWRALQVIPPTRLKNAKPDFVEHHHDFLTYVDGIYVSSDLTIKADKLNERHYFVFDIMNVKFQELQLINVNFAYNSLQCKLSEPLLKPKSIRNKETIFIEGFCISKNVGKSKELVLFDFGEFTIGRWLYHEVNQTEFARTRYGYKDFHDFNASRLDVSSNNDIVRGQRPVAPPRFISVRMGDYPVPQNMIQLMVEHKDRLNSMELEQAMLRVKPVLSRELSLVTYADRFHTLLHLEEIITRMGMTKYDQNATSLVSNGEFLMLDIPNLAERRPSLLVGDRIIVKDAYNNGATEFEGFIHKMSANHVYLKFADVWQTHYNGEDVSVRAIASRTMIRRLHQAVGLVVSNLGERILFPCKIIPKQPQVLFTFDKYEKRVNGAINNLESIVDKKLNGSASNETEEKGVEQQNRRSIRLLKKLETLKTSPQSQSDSDATKSKLLLHTFTEEESIRCMRGQKMMISKRKSLDISQTQSVKLEWFDKSLNYYQKEAVRNVLLGEARPLPYFIFGPPGTGKTVTLIETILQLLRLIPHSRLLVATPSNSAADLVATRLIESQVLKPGDMIRLVSFKYMSDEKLPELLIPYSATAEIARDGTKKQDVSFTSNGLALGCNSTVIGRHRITVGTCGCLAILYNMGFTKGHFTHIIVDEAGQCSEPEVAIPLAFLDVSSGQAVLAGDPMQLGPVLLNTMASKYGLGESFLQRILNRFPYCRDAEGFPNSGGFDPRLVTRLVYNYRSLPEILQLPNSLFYNDELQPTIMMEDSQEGTLLNKLKEILPQRKRDTPALVFHGVIGEDSQSEDCPSWYNPDEVSQVFFYVHEMYRLGLKASDIGIISPYLKQVQQLRSMFNEAEFDLPKIGTVEDFQGQEYNVIILSTVRSNSDYLQLDARYALGFISNPKRLNVAITRAKSLMLIVGNPFLLSQDVYWRAVITYCVNKQSYCGCDFP